MGTLKPQWIIGLTVEYKNHTAKLDKFVEEHPRLFTRSKTQTNGYINYIMFWDGSKEGWDDSNEGDKLRNQFLKLMKEAGRFTVYEIVDPENYEPKIQRSYIHSHDAPEWVKSINNGGGRTE